MPGMWLKKIDQLPALTETTLDFVNTFSRSSYPEVIKEAALFNLALTLTNGF